MARLLIDQLSNEEWDPTKHPNEYRQALRKLLASKKKFAVSQPAKGEEGKDDNVVDLMEALRRSVSKAGGGAKARPRKAAAKRGAA